MEYRNVVFHSIDREIMESYRKMLEGMADYWGDSYEFVLHSLENCDKSVIAIINGFHTGRQLGAPITDLALEMLGKIERNQHSDYISYFTHNKAGDPLKSTTIAIRGYKHKVIGLLCINLYLNTAFSTFIQQFSPSTGSGEASNMEQQESFAVDAQALLEQSFRDAQLAVVNNPSIPYTNRIKEIVQILYNKQIFNLKNSVSYVAQSLGVSKNTIYMHIRNFRKPEGE